MFDFRWGAVSGRDRYSDSICQKVRLPIDRIAVHLAWIKVNLHYHFAKKDDFNGPCVKVGIAINRVSINLIGGNAYIELNFLDPTVSLTIRTF